MARGADPLRPAIRCGRWHDSTLRVAVRVQPRSRDAGIGNITAGRLQIRVTGPPAEGRANEQARRILAAWFGVAPSRVTLVAGPRHRDKVFAIDAPAHLPDALRDL